MAAMGVNLWWMMMMMMVTMMIGAAAQAPAPSVDCQTEVLTLSDCLSFVTGTDKAPSSACCSELSSVVSSNPQCLCLLFNTSFTEPLGVNTTLALELPPLCKVQTPPTSLCSSFGAPVPSPVSSTMAPTPAKALSPAMAPTTAVPMAAPGPSVDCMTEVLTLSDCLSYVTGTDKTPSAACCSELSSTVSSSPQCLCLLFNTTFTAPLGVNITRAEQLPPLCKVQTPPTSLCSAVGVPVPGPMSSGMAPTTSVKAPSSAPMALSASTPTPNTAPSIISKNAAAIMTSLLFLASIFLS